MRWWRRNRREQERLLNTVWAIHNQQLDGTRLVNNAIRTLDPFHGPINKDAMRGPIPSSANSIAELYRADLAARCCCCGRSR